MAQVSQYHIIAENPTHILEADVEVEYYIDATNDEVPKPETIQFFEIIATSKATGMTEFLDEMPDDLEGWAKEEAEDQFKVE